MKQKIDPNLGLDKRELLQVVDRLNPHIQKMINNTPRANIILLALSEPFVALLKTIGASSSQLKKFSTGLAELYDPSANDPKSVEQSYQFIDPELTALIDEGFDPVAVAWALMIMMVQIIDRMPDLESDRKQQFSIDMITHINAAQQAGNCAASH